MPGSAQAQSDRTPGSAPLKFWEITPDQWRRFVAVRTTAPLALGERRLARDDDRRPSQGDRGFESVSLQPSSGESIANRTAARGIFPKSCLAPVEAAAPDGKSSGSAACSNIAPQNARSHAQGLGRIGSTATRTICLSCKARSRAGSPDRCGGRPADRASRCARLHSPGTRRKAKAEIA